MKIILIGATGTIGKYVRAALEHPKNEILTVGRKSGDYQVDITQSNDIVRLYQKLGSFDAVVNASGEVAFVPFQTIREKDWNISLQSKLMGQIQLVQQALPYINEGGSFTLVSGILSEQFIQAGTIATTVNRALEGFVQAASCELPKQLRINIISPTLLTDSVSHYGEFFPGFKPIDGPSVGAAFKKAVMGIQTGQIFRVF